MSELSFSWGFDSREFTISVPVRRSVQDGAAGPRPVSVPGTWPGVPVCGPSSTSSAGSGTRS